jgi:hypothetical protein
MIHFEVKVLFQAELATYVNTKRVSNFRPTVAKDLIKRYSSDGGIILDPAAGYGIEPRNPFLSRRVFEYALQMHAKLPLGPSHVLKWPLRLAYKTVLNQIDKEHKSQRCAVGGGT